MNKRSVLPYLSISLLSLLCTQSVQAVVSIGPQVIVTGTTINILEPGPDIQAIIDGIDDESASKPYLIKLGPGEYTIEPDITTSNGLVMAQYVSIMGSGQDVTILKGAVSSGSPASTSAIVTGASNANLTNLTVWNTGTGANSIALLISGASPHIENVTAKTTGAATQNWAVNIESASPTMINVNALAMGSNFNYRGINLDSASPTMRNVTADASVTTIASSFGMHLDNTSSPIMTGLTATGKFGVFVDDTTSAPKVYSSILTGTTNSISFDASTGLRITNTLLDGNVVDGAGATTNCRDTFKADLTDASC